MISEPLSLLDYWDLKFFFNKLICRNWVVFLFRKKKCCYVVFLIMVSDGWLLTLSNRVLICFTSFWIKFVLHISCNTNNLKEKHYYIFYLYNYDFLTWEQIKVEGELKFLRSPRCIAQTSQTYISTKEIFFMNNLIFLYKIF